uniref:IraD/Gp25-like domain-containing protein n=1 Tax=Candidatus Kentrum sp. LPFa TaxID=2126335 RepID=A0A450WK57_9GAMM|nr:MAG: hypothetical protein BECKLPF1236B_GA0070989_11172 [Candidatus Kentron sp. LPFa]
MIGADDVVVGLADIDQCVQTILLTPKGSCPHRPTFGCGIHQYLDRPQDRATPHLVRESVQAIREFEPRIGEFRILVSHAPGHVTLEVTWAPKGRDVSQATRVVLPVLPS